MSSKFKRPTSFFAGAKLLQKNFSKTSTVGVPNSICHALGAPLQTHRQRQTLISGLFVKFAVAALPPTDRGLSTRLLSLGLPRAAALNQAWYPTGIWRLVSPEYQLWTKQGIRQVFVVWEAPSSGSGSPSGMREAQPEDHTRPSGAA